MFSSHPFITEVCRKQTFFLTCEENYLKITFKIGWAYKWLDKLFQLIVYSRAHRIPRMRNFATHVSTCLWAPEKEEAGLWTN